MDKFGNLFQSYEGVTDGSTIKNSRSVGLFFGANWCEPCKNFLPKLISFYEQINQDIHQMEIIYIGMDNKQSEFDELIRDMPWLYYEWKEPIKYKIYLEYRQLIKGIPCLIIINPNNGNVITIEGRAFIEKDGIHAFDKFFDYK